MTDFSMRKSRKIWKRRGESKLHQNTAGETPTGAGDAGNAWGEGISPWELLLPSPAGEKTMGYIRGTLEFSSSFHKSLDPTGQGDPQDPHSRAVPSTEAESSTQKSGISMDFPLFFFSSLRGEAQGGTFRAIPAPTITHP